MVSRLGEFTIDRFEPGAPAGYPTLCKGRFVTGGRAAYLFEEPGSLNVIDILPDLAKAGVTALKIEGRQRGRAYVGRVVATFRRAVEAAVRGERLAPSELAALTEGGKNTLGAYRKAWQ